MHHIVKITLTKKFMIRSLCRIVGMPKDQWYGDSRRYPDLVIFLHSNVSQTKMLFVGPQKLTTTNALAGNNCKAYASPIDCVYISAISDVLVERFNDC